MMDTHAIKLLVFTLPFVNIHKFYGTIPTYLNNGHYMTDIPFFILWTFSFHKSNHTIWLSIIFPRMKRSVHEKSWLNNYEIIIQHFSIPSSLIQFFVNSIDDDDSLLPRKKSIVLQFYLTLRLFCCKGGLSFIMDHSSRFTILYNAKIKYFELCGSLT